MSEDVFCNSVLAKACRDQIEPIIYEGVWVGSGEVGARVVALSTNGMPLARVVLRTMVMDFGVLS